MTTLSLTWESLFTWVTSSLSLCLASWTSAAPAVALACHNNMHLAYFQVHNVHHVQGMHTNRDIVLTTVNHNFNLFPQLRLIAISVKKCMLRTEVKALQKNNTASRIIIDVFSALPGASVWRCSKWSWNWQGSWYARGDATRQENWPWEVPPGGQNCVVTRRSGPSRMGTTSPSQIEHVKLRCWYFLWNIF